MTIEEIFSKLVAHMKKGVMIHNQISIIYGFLDLCGYQKCHEYHYFSESKNCKCVQNYYLEHYHKLIPEESFEKPDLIPNNWYKHTKHDVDVNIKRSTVKELMKTWVEWETETKKDLEMYYKELYNMGEICAATKIMFFLKDVDKELKKAEHKYLKLETLGYDIKDIIGEQKTLYKKYKEKME